MWRKKRRDGEEKHSKIEMKANEIIIEMKANEIYRNTCKL